MNGYRTHPLRGLRCWRSANTQSGVGLIEVMVAVLVLSIGFLGVGALLAMSLSTNNSAMTRSLATVSSYSIFDAMRVDIGNAKAGKYNTTVSGNACPNGVNTLADNQLKNWCNQLADGLGAEATTIGTVNCSTRGDCTVTIQFDDSRAGTGGTNQQQIITRAIL